MRTIDVAEITNHIKEMCIEANHFLTQDMDAAMKSAADAAEYLKKLGFDLSDLDGEKAMSEIDTAYLFPQQPAA